MSTQDWKNGELTHLLSEAWGFKFNTELLSEGRTPVQTVGEDLDTDDELQEGTPDVGDAETIEDDEAGTTGDLKRGLNEDSGAEESAHARDNLAHDRYRMDDIEHHLDELEKHHADSEHIRDIRDRLHDLRKDMDHDYDEEHDDHNRYEDEAGPMDEIESRKEPNHRKSKEDPRLKEAQIRKLVRSKLKAMMENKNGRSKRVAKVSKRRK